jgi:hypothetical protein
VRGCLYQRGVLLRRRQPSGVGTAKHGATVRPQFAALGAREKRELSLTWAEVIRDCPAAAVGTRHSRFYLVSSRKTLA